jgi:hypothetical protein
MLLGPIVALLRASEPTPSTVSWDAPPECSDAATIESRLAERLPAGVSAPRARFTVTKLSHAWRVHAVVGDDDAASRVLDGATCDEIVEAAIVLVLVAATAEPAEPSPPPRQPVGKPSPVATEAATTEVRPVAPASRPTAPARRDETTGPAPQPTTSRRRASDVWPMLDAGAGVSALLSGRAAALISGTVGIAGRRWSAAAGATHVVVHPVDVGGLPRARVWLTSFDLRGCGEPGVGRWQFPLCVGASVGAAGGTGVDVVDARRNRSPWIALRLGLGARFWAGRSIGVFARVEPVVVVGKPALVVTGLGTACCGATAGLQGAAGLVARFGGPTQ